MKKNFTLKKTAELLGVSKRTVYRLIESGQLIAWKSGAALRVTEESIDAYRDREILSYAETNEISVTRYASACHAVLNKLTQ
jgi:excisionase family DNA binding protein